MIIHGKLMFLFLFFNNLNFSKAIWLSKHYDLLLQGHEMRRLKAIRRQDIFIDENIYGGMTLGELCQAQAKEVQLVQQDITMERTKEKKNALEAYVYETRNKVNMCVSLLVVYYFDIVTSIFDGYS